MEQQTQTQNQESNRPIYNSQALKIRLDTQELLEKIELFLRGAMIKVEQTEDNQIITRKIIIGVPKANDNGIQAVINWISATINPQTVQGNFYADDHGNSEKYDNYIQEYHIELTTLLIDNCYNWEIVDEEINGIIEFIMLLVIPFMSRLINNEERNSYKDTIKSVENTNIQSKGGGIPLLSN